MSLTTGRRSLDHKPKISGRYVAGAGRHSSHNSDVDVVAAGAGRQSAANGDLDVAVAGPGAGRQSAADGDLDLAQLSLEVGVDLTDGGVVKAADGGVVVSGADGGVKV